MGLIARKLEFEKWAKNLVYVNDMQKAMRYCSVNEFGCYTNLHTNKSPKQINKHINHNLKHLCHWIKSNLLSLNDGEKIFIFRNRFQQINKKRTFRVGGICLNLYQNSIKQLVFYLR